MYQKSQVLPPNLPHHQKMIFEMELRGYYQHTKDHYLENLKHKTIFLTTYSSGLRISETLNLRICDIDSVAMLIRVNHGKGNKDRLTILSHENLKLLRLYWKQYRPTDLLFPGPIEG